ncbi:hypothetical protein SAY87_010108 [Trapa incisa]|uniref:Uncharacterized protein n=1 Tax=Trapa incisa TaxID=236973 RepID=A0AAN7JAN3_9MYRT|nr:hypothetical protein SAY87_010108 [Trapa incisa]
MALDIEWYDFVCFGIVGVAFIGALWILYRHEGISGGSGISAGDSFEGLLRSRRKLARTDGHVGTDCLWTSCWKGVHPGCLLVTRFVSFLAMVGFLYWDVMDSGASVFIYYTEWTFALVIVYFGLGTIVSAHGCWLHTIRKSSSAENKAIDDLPGIDPEESVSVTSNDYNGDGDAGINGNKSTEDYGEEGFLGRAGFWGYLMQITYQTSAGAVVLTDIMFWCIIAPFLSIAHVRLNWLMGCMHTLNAVFLLIDTGLNNLVSIP